MVQAAGECEWRNKPGSEPVGVRDGGGEVAPGRAGLAAMEADQGGDTEIAAGHPWSFQVLGQDLDPGQRVLPSPRLVEQFAENAVRLSQPERRADLAGQVPRLPGHGQRLV